MQSCTRRPIAKILLTALIAAPAAHAEIAGEQVVSGTATFDQSGTVITITASDGAIINYSQFGVLASEEMHFLQPSSESRVLNRVLGDATHIDGGLYANGIVYIVNPAGVFFGDGAIIDVGGLYAAAGDISNEDFLARIDRFALSGLIENAGSIESPAVALLGTQVANHGNIHAPDGTIALVAGEKVLLTELGAHIAVQVEGVAGSAEAPAIEQTGSVDAGAGSVSFTTGDVYSLAINHTGITRGREIELRAESGTVQVAGTLDASDRSAGGTGGSIAVTGERVALLGAQLDASGDAGGGEIRVGGDLHGEGALPNARRTYVDEGSSLHADAISSGDGGRVIVWSDEATAFHGDVSARGGATSGDGGFAEISGAQFLTADGDVDLGAASGAAGTLLYDPKDIVLHIGTLDGSDDPDASDTTLSGASLGQVLFGTPDEVATPFDVYESELEGTNANIVLQATNSISSTDTFAVAIQPGNSLTMQTRNDPGDETGTSLTPGIHLANVSFQTTGAPITLSTGDGAIEVGSLTTSGAAGAVGGAAGAINVLAGDADKNGQSHVTTGILTAAGGVGTNGAGGAGGAVTVQSNGAVANLPDTTTDPTLGGGSITVAGVVATGGAGTTTGGIGGAVKIGGTRVVNGVQLDSTDGAIDVGAIDTSGGAGGTTGGSAGSILIETRDANRDGLNDVTTGALVAIGGSGAGGAGGRGGNISVLARRSIEITGPAPQDPAGGGDISIASIEVGGGSAAVGTGGRGGNVSIVAGNGSIDAGAISSTGGSSSNGNGGRGGDVSLTTANNDLVVDDPISTRGGDGTNAAATAVGGNGGNITLTTGIEEDDTGNVLLQALLDAGEGASANTNESVLANVDGGAISITSAGSIDQTGTAPRITTTGDVSLTAEDDIGQATGSLLVKGGNERRPGSGGSFLDEDTLTVSAGGTADVDVVAGGLFLNAVRVTATSDSADLHVTQSGGDVVDMTGSAGQNRVVVNQVDTLASKTDVQVTFHNPDEDTPDGELVLATGVIDPGRGFDARSDGDIVVGTTDGTVFRAGADPDATAPVTAAFVILAADQDHDGTGALRTGSDGAVIDMLGDADEPGELLLFAGSGIGAAGDPIQTTGGALLSAFIQPRTADTREGHEGEFVADPAATAGIYVSNVASANAPTSDLEIAQSTTFSTFHGAFIESGTGDIEITNAVGDLIVTGGIDAKPADLATDGAGGDVKLAVSDPGAAIVLDTAFAIESGGGQVYDGDVVLARAASILADGGVDINGGLDTRDTAANPVGFTATLGDEATDVTTFSVSGGIGDTRALGSFAIRAPDGGDVALDTPLVRTTGLQTYSADLNLAQFTAFDAGTQIRFDQVGEQTVTGPAGFSLGTSGVPISPEATIAKPNGNLTLASPGGSILIGDGQKLSVAGSLTITATAGTVRFTDLSALDISVTSPDAQMFARAPAQVATPSGVTIEDGGTDLVANTVAFSSAPTIVGGGPAPRIATPSGTAQNAGALALVTLPAPISAADIAPGSRVFDLAIPASDPGHETQEIPTAALEPALGPQPSRDRAAPGASVSREEVSAFLACAPVGDEAMPAGCTAAPASPAYGSALDTERAVEIARAYRDLLGDSPDAAAGRASLARAAADPRAEVGQASSPAGRVYLTEVARVLGQVRLLGLGERYGEVRADLLTAVAAAIGSPQLDAARLGKAVDARAMGMPI